MERAPNILLRGEKYARQFTQCDISHVTSICTKVIHRERSGGIHIDHVLCLWGREEDARMTAIKYFSLCTILLFFMSVIYELLTQLKTTFLKLKVAFLSMPVSDQVHNAGFLRQ